MVNGMKKGWILLLFPHSRTKVHLVRSAIGDIKVCLVFSQFCWWKIQLIFYLSTPYFQQANIGLLQWFLNGIIQSGDFVKKLNGMLNTRCCCFRLQDRRFSGAERGTKNIACFSGSAPAHALCARVSRSCFVPLTSLFCRLCCFTISPIKGL